MAFSTGDLIGIGFRLLGQRERIGNIIETTIVVLRETKILPADVTPQAVAAMAPQPTSGFSVRWVQEALNKLDNAGLREDNDYGEMTRAAIKKFQEANGLYGDGWAGVETCVMMYNKLRELTAKKE